MAEGRPLAMVRIGLAQCAVDFVAASVDLLASVEGEQALVSDEILEAAAELRAVIERGGW